MYSTCFKTGNALEQSAVELSEDQNDDRLATLYKVSIQDDKGNTQLKPHPKQGRTTFWDENKIEQLTNPVSWRILKRADDGTTSEEVIFTVQGIIQLKDLPPVVEKTRCVLGDSHGDRDSYHSGSQPTGASTYARACRSQVLDPPRSLARCSRRRTSTGILTVSSPKAYSCPGPKQKTMWRREVWTSRIDI